MVTDAEWPDKTPRELKKWTVMVYMVAGNDAELDAVAVKDLREMERGVGSKPDDSKDLHVVAQINRAWPDTPQRYEVRRSAHSKRVESVLCDVDVQTDNMGEGATLERFLKWAPAKFPAEHYLLVLWGHGYGLGFGRDHGDPLTLNELTAALKTFRETRAQLGTWI